jgi:plastocyanin
MISGRYGAGSGNQIDKQKYEKQRNSMKKMIQLMTCAVVAAMSMEAAKAALNIPSDGSDGALVITNNTVIDLSQAVTNNWDANNSANAGKGIYDANKWAVVFKYSSVTIQGGATVSFANHASRAPVVWLVQSNVTINGTVSLDGQGYLSSPLLAEPGPGGFRGGSGKYATGVSDAAGFGPGGGNIRAWDFYGWRGAGGSYGSQGYYSSVSTYGNPSLIPLVGGSGGAGGEAGGIGGGSGAGAMLIANGGSMAISGTIRANGGYGSDQSSGGGSAGGIRLVSDSLSGSGVVQAIGTGNRPGGLGRIRIERVLNSSTLQVNPDPSVVVLSSGTTPLIWLPANGPSVRIISIGGNTPPADPRAEFGAIGADTVLPLVSSTTVVIETTNVESASAVTVRATPRANGNYTQATASPSLPPVSEDPLVIRWTANVPVNSGYSAIQVKVVRP